MSSLFCFSFLFASLTPFSSSLSSFPLPPRIFALFRKVSAFAANPSVPWESDSTPAESQEVAWTRDMAQWIHNTFPTMFPAPPPSPVNAVAGSSTGYGTRAGQEKTDEKEEG